MSDYIRSLENISFRCWYTDTTYVILNNASVHLYIQYALNLHVKKKKHVHIMCLYTQLQLFKPFSSKRT